MSYTIIGWNLEQKFLIFVAKFIVYIEFHYT